MLGGPSAGVRDAFRGAIAAKNRTRGLTSLSCLGNVPVMSFSLDYLALFGRFSDNPGDTSAEISHRSWRLGEFIRSSSRPTQLRIKSCGS